MKKETTAKEQEKKSKGNNVDEKHPIQNIDALEKEAEEKTNRKPGSQTHHTERHNNGRGGGK